MPQIALEAADVRTRQLVRGRAGQTEARNARTRSMSSADASAS